MSGQATSRGILRRVSAPEALRSPLTADPARAAVFCRHRRDARADRPARRGRPRARGGVAAARRGSRAATAAWPASRAARPPTRAGSWAWAASPMRARTARSCSSPAAAGRRSPRRSALGAAGPALRPRPRHAGAAAAAGADRGQGRHRRLPLARRARRGGGARPPREDRRRRPRRQGLTTHWGRKVLEIRPAGADRQGPGGARPSSSAPVARRALRRRRRHRPRRLRRARVAEAEGELEAVVRVGCARTRARRRSSSEPTSWSTAWRASRDVLAALADGVRFRDFLRVAVLLFGGAATALAVVSVVGAAREDTNTLVYVAAGWWCARRARRPLARAPAGRDAGDRRPARLRRARTNTLPELEPGAVMFNRLWPLAVLAIASGVIGFFFPQVPVVATGYCLLVALLWRNQSTRGRGDRGPRRRGVLVRQDLAVRRAEAPAPARPAQDRAG